MKPWTWLSFVVLTTIGSTQVRAQAAATPTPRPTPPAPPLVADAPDPSAWTITEHVIPGLASMPADAVVRSASAASPPFSVATVTRVGPVRHRSRKLKTGEQEDVWYERGNRITMESIWKIPLFEGATSQAKQPLGPDFPELSWISAANFVGVQEYQGGKYYIFETQIAKGDARSAADAGNKMGATLNRAYIDAASRLPWLLQAGNTVQGYVFQPAPPAAIDVPAEYQTMFDTYERKKLESVRKPLSP